MKLRLSSAVAAMLMTLPTGALVAAPVLMAPASVQAAAPINVGQLLSGLINANLQDIEVTVIDGDVTVEDLVDVDNVLNNNQVDILRNAIQNNPIASNNQDFLNDLLRDANIITDNQVVVGVLTGGQLVIDTLPAL